MLRRTNSIFLMLALSGCGGTPVLWTEDGGSSDSGPDSATPDAEAPDAHVRDATPPDAPSDGALPDDECPCETYCYAVRGEAAIRNLVAPAPGEVWSNADPAEPIERTLDGTTERIDWPRADGEMWLFGDDEPWAGWNGDSPDEHALYRWTGSAWEAHSIPPFEPGTTDRLRAVRAGDRLLATYAHRGNFSAADPRVFVWDEGWSVVRPWGEGEWVPWVMAGSEDVLAVQLERVDREASVREIATWARFGDGEWVRVAYRTLHTSTSHRYFVGIAGDLVLVDGQIYDGTGASYPLTSGVSPDMVLFAGRAAGVRWALTTSAAYDLTDPAAPLRYDLPFRPRAAAFPAEGPVWIGGPGLAYWGGHSFTVTRVWRDQALPWDVAAAYGTPSDFHVISPSLAIRRFRSGVIEDRSLPEVPWAGTGGRLRSLVEWEGTLVFGMRGGVGFSDGTTWMALQSTSEIDASFSDTEDVFLAAGDAGLFAGIGSSVYRWDGAAFVHEVDLAEPTSGLTTASGVVWAIAGADMAYERRASGWVTLPAVPRGSFVWSRLHAHDGHLVVLSYRASGAEGFASEWDGTTWTRTDLPGVHNGSQLAGRGVEVVVASRDGQQWRRRGLGDWVLDTSCDGPLRPARLWWPEGEPSPWILGMESILRPREGR